MSYSKLEELMAYQHAVELNVAAYPVISRIRDRDIRSQMIRCMFSIPSNIAEGAGRYSDAEFAKFLTYASGSCKELHTQLQLSVKLGLTREEIASPIITMCDRQSALLYGLIRALRR